MKNSLNISLKQYVNLTTKKTKNMIILINGKTLVADGIIYGQCL